MSLKFTIALVAVIAYASPALTGGSNNRDTSKSAQYCVPQYDNSDGPRVYCSPSCSRSTRYPGPRFKANGSCPVRERVR